MIRPGRKAGFRLSVADVLFLAAAAAAFVLLRGRLGTGAWVIPFAVGHFFLFCNVFRVRRAYELAWAAVFLVNAGAWMAAGRLSWGVVMAIQVPFTLAAIGLEMRSRAYHGIGCRRINAAHIDAWLHTDSADSRGFHRLRPPSRSAQSASICAICVLYGRQGTGDSLSLKWEGRGR